MKADCLFSGGVDRDGLALGIVKAVHRVDVHHPADTDEHDDQQQSDDQKTHKNSGRHESNTVPRVAKGEFLLVGTVERSLQLQGLEAQRVVTVIDGSRLQSEVTAGVGERGGGIHNAGNAERFITILNIAQTKVSTATNNIKDEVLGCS